MGIIARNFNLDGINLQVVSKKNVFDVIITISGGANLTKKRKSGGWSIEFKGTTYTNNEKLKKPRKNSIIIQFKGEQYDKKKLGKPFERSFLLDGKIEGRIRIAPEFYLSEELREEYLERVHQKRDKAFKEASQEATKKNTKKKATVYPPNNLFRPYQGGSCTPK